VPIELTVALCTYNPRPDLMTRAVRAVISQLGELGDSAEFVIVDNNSTPPLLDADHLRGLPLIIIREPLQGLTAARAAAIRKARGRIVLFVDDDNVIGPGYLKGVVSAFADPALGLLGGSVVPEYESAPPAWLTTFEDQLAIRRHPADLDVETTALPFTGYFPVGAGMAVLRTLAVAHVRDSETTGRIEGRRGLALSSGEDLDLNLFVLKSGYKLRVIGSLTLTHVIPAERLTEQYISRLVVASIASTAEIDRKWSPRVGAPVFDFLHRSRASSALRWLYFQLLSPISVKSRVKRRAWEAIYRLRTDQSKNAIEA
jgi:glycosyltransferase involved in cell wall biosynthesis